MWQEDLSKAIRDFINVRQLTADAEMRESLAREQLAKGVRDMCDAVTAAGGEATVEIEEGAHRLRLDLGGYAWERSVSVEPAADAVTVFITWMGRGSQPHTDEWKVELKEADTIAEKISTRLAGLLALDLRVGGRR